jgi:chloramphenicol O-acetyltransferase type B
MRKVNIRNFILIPKMKLSCLLFDNKIDNRALVIDPFLLRKSSIAKYCYIARNSGLYNVSLGPFSSIGPNVVIGGLEHLDSSLFTTSCFLTDVALPARTNIGADVWIGANVFVRAGIKIGHGAVVGAGSVVINDLLPYSINVGVPARQIRNRFDDETIGKLLQHEFWELSYQEAAGWLRDFKTQLHEKISSVD